MGKKSKGPSASETAKAQTESNQQTAIFNAALNRINQYTPYGSLTYETSGKDANGVPIYTQRVNLNDTGQQLLDLQNNQDLQLGTLAGNYLGQIGDISRTPYSYDGIQALPTTGDINADRDQYQQALLARINPSLQQDRSAAEARLLNQGITQGSEAYRNAMDELNRNSTDARYQAIINSGQLANQDYSRALSQRQQAIQEYAQQRSAPLNEYAALMSNAQVQNPTFANVAQVGAQNTDVAGITQAAQNAKAAQGSSFTSGLFGLAGTLGGSFLKNGGAAALLASDERLKENIRHVGKTDGGHNLYSYNYKGSHIPQIGVMAQELMKTKPEAVVMMPNGYLAVDYAQVY